MPANTHVRLDFTKVAVWLLRSFRPVRDESASEGFTGQISRSTQDIDSHSALKEQALCETWQHQV